MAVFRVGEEPVAGRLGFRLLVQEDVERIHRASLDILEGTGIIIRHGAARRLLRSRGANVEDAGHLVRIPPELVSQAIAWTPQSFTLYGSYTEDARRDLVVCPGGAQYARSGSGLNFIVDHGATKRRPVGRNDVVDWVRINHRLPHVHIVSALFDQDGVPESADVRSVAAMLRYTDKPLMTSAIGAKGIRTIKRMVEFVQGSDRAARVMVLSSVNSPLIYDYDQIAAALACAEEGFPVVVNSSAMSAAAGPVTLAGNVVLMHAEILAALTILQLHRPGAPVIYAGHPTVMDLRTGSGSIAAPEIGLMAAACVEMGCYLGLPTGTNGVNADSHQPDAMAAIEKYASTYLPVLSGANISGSAGTLSCQSTVSLEQLVIDNEVYGTLFRHLRGIDTGSEKLGVDAIRRVGPAGTFLLDEHTLTHMREEYAVPLLAKCENRSAWEAGSRESALESASAMVKNILSEPHREFTSVDQNRELDRMGC